MFLRYITISVHCSVGFIYFCKFFFCQLPIPLFSLRLLLYLVLSSRCAAAKLSTSFLFLLSRYITISKFRAISSLLYPEVDSQQLHH